MAGASTVTLYRSEDATIRFQFQAQQAARISVPDLSLGTLTVEITAYPTETVVLSIHPGEVAASCTLTLTDPASGRALLFIPKGFWTGLSASRFLVQAWIDTGNTTQRLGEQLFDLEA